MLFLFKTDTFTKFLWQMRSCLHAFCICCFHFAIELEEKKKKQKIAKLFSFSEWNEQKSSNYVSCCIHWHSMHSDMNLCSAKRDWMEKVNEKKRIYSIASINIDILLFIFVIVTESAGAVPVIQYRIKCGRPKHYKCSLFNLNFINLTWSFISWK